jgi:hypothetical protein
MTLKRLLSASLLLAALAASAAAQGKAVEFRQGDAFRGPVESARLEQVTYSREDGVLVEGPRRLSVVFNYSPDGRRKEYESYAPDGSLRTRHVYVYDEAGNEVEMTVFDGEGDLQTRRVHDPDAGETLTYNGDGSLRERRVATLSTDGTQVEMRRYDGGGELKEQGARPRAAGGGTWNTYGPDSVPGIEAGSSRDQRGRHRAGSQTSAPNRRVIFRRFSEVDAGVSDQRETREYDSRGNLLKVTNSKWDAETGEYEPSAVTHCTITYYR